MVAASQGPARGGVRAMRSRPLPRRRAAGASHERAEARPTASRHPRDTAAAPPPAVPAAHRHHAGPTSSASAGAERHVGTPQARAAAQARRRHQRRIRPGAGSDGQQEADAFAARAAPAAGPSRRPRSRAPPSTLGKRDHDQAQHHGAARAERIGRRADGQPQRHAGELHQRQQEAGLHQADAQRFAQHRQRRRQLADVQCRADAGQHHQRRRSASASARAAQASRAPGQPLVLAHREAVGHAGDVVGHRARRIGSRWRSPAASADGRPR